MCLEHATLVSSPASATFQCPFWYSFWSGYKYGKWIYEDGTIMLVLHSPSGSTYRFAMYNTLLGAKYFRLACLGFHNFFMGFLLLVLRECTQVYEDVCACVRAIFYSHICIHNCSFEWMEIPVGVVTGSQAAERLPLPAACVYVCARARV